MLKLDMHTLNREYANKGTYTVSVCGRHYPCITESTLPHGSYGSLAALKGL